MTTFRLGKYNVGGPEWTQCVGTSLDWHRVRRASFFIIVCWFFWSVSSKAFPLNESTAEYPVKLAFLYNFAKFVEWPSASFRSPEAPLAICIVGDDPFSPDLERELQTRRVDTHPVQLRMLRPTDTMSVCHMVFVPAAEKDQAARIVKSLKGSSILTVGETEGFTVLGGIINLTVEDSKVHFEVNLLAAERAGLKISSKLLSIAKIVKENEEDHGAKSWATR